jgi:hypothetical protein
MVIGVDKTLKEVLVMGIRKCKKCNRSLPEWYKQKICQSCQNKKVDGLKDAGKKARIVAGAAVIIASVAKRAISFLQNQSRRG